MAAGPVLDTTPAAPVEIQSNGASPALVEIFGFGAPRVLRAGQELSAADWTYTKARELLFYLLTHGPSTKEQIGLALWPDASAAQLRTTFHPTLHHLRRALGGSAWIALSQQRCDVNRSLPHTFDVEEFTRGRAGAARCGDGTGHSDAASRWRGGTLQWQIPRGSRLTAPVTRHADQLTGRQNSPSTVVVNENRPSC
jgi:hypothetical protein